MNMNKESGKISRSEILMADLTAIAASGRLLSYYSRRCIISVPMEKTLGSSGTYERLINAWGLQASQVAPGYIAIHSLLPQNSKRTAKELEEWVKNEGEKFAKKNPKLNLAFYPVQESALAPLDIFGEFS